MDYTERNALQEEHGMLKTYLDGKLPLINESIERFLTALESPDLLERMETVGRYGSETTWHAIVKPARYAIIKTGGKRYRPLLTHLVHDLVKGNSTPYKYINDLATIAEIVHKGTVVIDDIEDKEEVRNRVKTVHMEFGKELAQNLGGTLYDISELYLKHPDLFLTNGNGEKKIGKEKQNRIRGAIPQELIAAHLGQGTDLRWSVSRILEEGHKLPEIEEYYQMAVGKSTFPLAFRIGAILGGATEEQEKLLRQTAEYAGLAFQIKDDLLDLNPSISGYGGDIREKKVTLPVLLSLNLKDSNAERLREILSIRGKPASEGQLEDTAVIWRSVIDEAVGIMRNNGTIEQSQFAANDYANWAKNLLRENFPEPDREKPRLILEELIDLGVKREK